MIAIRVASAKFLFLSIAQSESRLDNSVAAKAAPTKGRFL